MTPTDEFQFNLRTSDLDLPKIEEEIRFKIRQRQELGVYEHFDMSRVTSYVLRSIRDQEESLKQHLSSILRSWAIDINDFEIALKKRGVLGRLEVLVKKILWKLLKFYTYRLFSQQREFNFQVSQTAVLMEKCYRERLEALEAELSALKSKNS